LSIFLNQETAKGPFWSLSQAATCNYTSLTTQTKVEAIALSALPKETIS